MPEAEITVEIPTVQLTRMEGVLNLINYKVDALTPRVEQHEHDIAELKLNVQRLGDEAESRDAIVVASAKALKEAKEEQDAAASARWTPTARILAVLGGLSSLAGVYLALHGVK